MAYLPPFEERFRVVDVELDRLVQELDQRLDRDFLADLQPAIARLPEVRESPSEREASAALQA
jgi:hypothetical protein